MVFKSNAVHNYTFSILDGTFTKSNGSILDISGIGADLSGTQMLKIAPIDNESSFYSLLDLSNNSISLTDCSGFNIIRVANGSILGVGYISNPTSVNAFTSDTSGNLWVGGNAMTVSRSSQNSVIANTESMFMIPYNTPTLPTAFLHVDVSGCNDICPVRNLMMATVVDVSGRCLNFASGTNASLDVDGTTFPRLNDASAAFDVYTSPQAGGAPVEATKADVSGHRLVSFARSGTTGYDVSGFYIVRQNTTTGNGSTASSTTGLVAGSNPGIKYDISLNKIAFETSRNQLYVGTSTTGASSKLLVVPLDASSNVYAGHDISHNALFAYAAPTSTTSGAVDGSGFMFICESPSISNSRLLLDASGATFDILTLKDISGVNAMTSVMASGGTSNYNYLYLVDASRNTVTNSGANEKAKIAEIKVSARSVNDGYYFDGSGVTFYLNPAGSTFPLSSTYVRDIKADANGNVFVAGHQIYTITDTTTVDEIARANSILNILGAGNVKAFAGGAFTNDTNLLAAVDPNESTGESAKKITNPSATI